MIIDLLIMSYSVLMALLIYRAEKLPKHNIKVIISGLVFTPIIGAIVMLYYQYHLNLASKGA